MLRSYIQIHRMPEACNSLRGYCDISCSSKQNIINLHIFIFAINYLNFDYNA